MSDADVTQIVNLTAPSLSRRWLYNATPTSGPTRRPAKPKAERPTKRREGDEDAAEWVAAALASGEPVVINSARRLGRGPRDKTSDPGVVPLNHLGRQLDGGRTVF